MKQTSRLPDVKKESSCRKVN